MFPSPTKIQAVVRSRVQDDTSYLTYIEPSTEGEQRSGGCHCSCEKPEISTEICEHVMAHIKAAGLNVEDFIPVYQTATYWSNQYEVLRIERARFLDLYHG
jgi:hypothetical protein